MYDKILNSFWIATLKNGLHIISNKEGRLHAQVIKGIPNQPILALESGSDTTLFLGIDGQGLWEINKTTHKVLARYKHDADNPYSLKGNGVYDVYCDKYNRVWICTYSGGVSYFDQGHDLFYSWKSHIINNENSLINDEVNSIFEDSDGNLWYATSTGISFWNRSSNKWASYFSNKKNDSGSKRKYIKYGIFEGEFCSGNVYKSIATLQKGQIANQSISNRFYQINAFKPFDKVIKVQGACHYRS